MNLCEPIFERAAAAPTAVAVEDVDRSLDAAALAAAIRDTSARLAALDVGPGEVVSLWLTDSIEHLVLWYALAHRGAVIHDVDPSAGWKATAPLVRGVDSRICIVQRIPLDRGRVRFITVEEVFSAGPASPVDPHPGGDQPLMFLRTSGTTGKPKHTRVSHAAQIGRNRMLAQAFGMGAGTRFLIMPRMCFSSGRRRSMTVLQAGGAVVLNRSQGDEDLLRTLTGRRITFACFVPHRIRELLKILPEDRPLLPDATCSVIAAPITHEERLLARARLTPRFYECYNTSESSELAMASPEDQDRRPDSVGRLLPGIEARVIDVTGKVLPPGEVGLLGFRGPFLSSQYHGDPPEAARAFRDGWFHPGDLGSIDADGYVRLAGRADDVINNQGKKFYPVEVESLLRKVPGVVDAAVIGRPHPVLGEGAVAFLVTSGKVDLRDLQHLVKHRVGRHAIPFNILRLRELPRTPTGKVDSGALKRLHDERVRRLRRS